MSERLCSMQFRGLIVEVFEGSLVFWNIRRGEKFETILIDSNFVNKLKEAIEFTPYNKREGRGRPRLSKEISEEVVKLFKGGMSRWNIHKRMEIAPSTVDNILIREGVWKREKRYKTGIKGGAKRKEKTDENANLPVDRANNS